MINSRHYTLYELPGYQNQVISKQKATDPSQTLRQNLKQLVPLVPTLPVAIVNKTSQKSFYSPSPSLTQREDEHQKSIFSRQP
jgi:hypothetical protein